MSIQNVINRQLDLPVTFSDDGSTVSLKQWIHRDKATLAFSSLSENQLAELTIERIKLQPEVKLATLNSGIIDRDKAINEVKEQTPLGLALIEAEQILIERLLKEAEKLK